MLRDLVLRSRLKNQNDIVHNAVMLAEMGIGFVLGAVQSRVLKILVCSFEDCEWVFSLPVPSDKQCDWPLTTDQFLFFFFFPILLYIALNINI